MSKNTLKKSFIIYIYIYIYLFLFIFLPRKNLLFYLMPSTDIFYVPANDSLPFGYNVNYIVKNKSWIYILTSQYKQFHNASYYSLWLSNEC